MRNLVVSSLAVVVGWCTHADANTLTVPISSVAYISSERGEHRVLLSFDDLRALDSAIVTRAWLEVPVGAPYPEERLSLQVHPILSPWNPGSVDWETGWIEPGGDIDRDVYARVQIDGSRNPTRVRFDLSAILTEIIEERRETYGVLVTVPPFRGLGMRLADLPHLAGISNASITVEYRPILPRPSERRP